MIQRWERNICLPGIEILPRPCGVYGRSFEIVHTSRPRQRVSRLWHDGAHFVPVKESEGLPWARPSHSGARSREG
ncbi:MAG TPA: hypothetical protein VL126_13810 [Bacteroidota bacterium]|nr:hypothetical protein [Bacteroidota bacterium]